MVELPTKPGFPKSKKKEKGSISITEETTIVLSTSENVKNAHKQSDEFTCWNVFY